MPEFTEAEDRIIKRYISSHLSSSLALIRGAMESIWAIDAPRIIQNYTDHGIEHSERVAGFVEKLLLINPNLEFSEQEIYILLVGVYLHDIGMQCDVVKYPEVKKKAEKLGAKFNADFTNVSSNGFSVKEQKAIRENHNYLSAAWIDYLYEKNDDVLHPAVKSIPDDLVDDIMDICKFHSSKSSICDCDDSFRLDANNRKRMVAALMRFADELDISSTRVKLETVKIFNLDPDNSLYWWLHSYTKVIFIGSNRISLSVRLHPEDFELYGSFIREDYIKSFRLKNQPVLDVLVGHKIPVVVDNNSDIVAYSRAEKFPPEIIAIFNTKVQKKGSSFNYQIQASSGSLGEGHSNRISQSKEVMQLIRVALESNLSELDLSNNHLTRLPSEIGELKNLAELNVSHNQLTKLPSEIGELKNLTTLDVSYNQLIKLQSEIGELKNLTTLDVSYNQLTKLPSEIGELKNLTELDVSYNKLNQLPPEFRGIENLAIINISNNQLTKLPSEIGELKNLAKFCLSFNQLIQLPPEIEGLENLATFDLSYNQLSQLPSEIGELKNLTNLYLSYNQLTMLPTRMGELVNLTKLYISYNLLSQLPSEIGEINNLTTLELSGNPFISPPPEITSRGLEAVFTYLKQTKTIENNEAKLILVGNGAVGKTCLAYRLINNDFLDYSRITEGINISKWEIPAPSSEKSKIKLNIWDFGGQEIYHATHQFFLTKRSVYLLVWDARKTKDYVYYWLHTIEAFGEDSPIILVMSKMNEFNDDLNLKDIVSKFPQVVGYFKIDSSDGKGISSLVEAIRKTAWNLPLMRVRWVDSWFKVRKKLEGLRDNWIRYEDFNKICISEGLDDENIFILDEYLHELGVTLHFKDRLTLKNIIILKPEWATNAFYKILSTQSVINNEGVLPQKELSQIWDMETYPPSVYPQLMELMNKFELAYELPDKNSYLVPELLPKSEPDFIWDGNQNLCFYYCYDYFLPPGIISRFIVRMYQDIVKKENGMPLCWRVGTMLKIQNSIALVKMNLDEKQIEIKIKGDNNRGALGAICSQLDQIHTSINKMYVTKQIPCNCSENCPLRYPYEDLLKAEKNGIETIQCYKSFKHISIPSLLDGYKRREERYQEYGEVSRQLRQSVVFSPSFITKFDSEQINKSEQKIDVNTTVISNLKIDLPQILLDFENLRHEMERLNPELDSELNKIQDSLDEISTNSAKEKLVKPLNKLRRLLDKLSDPNSDYSKVITGTQKGIDLAQKVGRTYNKFAQWLAMPQVPDLLVGKS